MSELEMEIGRTLGASCFFIYQTIKANPNYTSLKVQIETGLSRNCVRESLIKLCDTKVLDRKTIPGDRTSYHYSYKSNDKEMWKFH